jgi:hypothetical protein
MLAKIFASATAAGCNISRAIPKSMWLFGTWIFGGSASGTDHRPSAKEHAPVMSL